MCFEGTLRVDNGEYIEYPFGVECPNVGKIESGSCGVATLDAIIELLEIMDDLGLGRIVITNDWDIDISLDGIDFEFECWYWYTTRRIAEVVEFLCIMVAQADGQVMPNFGPAGLDGAGIMSNISNITSSMGAFTPDAIGNPTDIISDPSSAGDDAKAQAQDMRDSVVSSLESIKRMLEDAAPNISSEPDKKRWRGSPCSNSSLPYPPY